MSMKVEIIADSLNPVGDRLTTFILEYPRFIHAEVMTHRMFSKNAASSRAIPTEKIIEQVMNNPAMPVWWGKNQSGMQAKEELDNNIKEKRYNVLYNPYSYLDDMTDMEFCKDTWLKARDTAIKYVRTLNDVGLHKQIANRILEPWFNIRIILSGTEFGNFFALRAHPDAQPEFQALAYKMLEEYNKSEPKKLGAGEWHIPFSDKIDERKLKTLIEETNTHTIELGGAAEYFDEFKIKIAIARCARVSYLNYEGKDDYAADIKLCDRLFGNVPRHLSPTEHVAEAQSNSNFIGNFKGWRQYRYFFNDQNLGDSRIIQK